MALAILCSGQGAQRPGMFDLTAQAPEARELFAHASTLLGQPVESFVRSAGEDVLRENFNAQLLCTLQGLGAYAALADLLAQRKVCVAGYSVGEIAAWSIAGLVSPQTTLDLVCARAREMDAASSGNEGMLAVRGLARTVVEALYAGKDAAIAIVNPDQAYVLAGKQDALAVIAVEATRRGAARVTPVPVRIASHTRWLAPASVAFRKHLQAVDHPARLDAGTRLFSGIDGTPVWRIDEGLDKLARQISQPVEWASCLEGCIEAGSTVFLELGPGRALTAMVAQAYPQVAARSLDEFRTLAGARQWLSKALSA